MYLLDTDTVSNLMREHSPISQKALAVPPDLLFISTITVHEMFSGSFDTLNRLYGRKPVRSSFTECSSGIVRLARKVNTFNIIPYQNEDEEQFALLAPRVKRIGPADCRIAMMAIRLGFIVITSNTRDFSRIPSVVFEDWSR